MQPAAVEDQPRMNPPIPRVNALVYMTHNLEFLRQRRFKIY